MNLVFEGINGSGKTTIIEGVRNELDSRQIPYHYISDLVYQTPLTPVLKKMLEGDVFLELNEQFETSLYESLILAANHHYIQEKMRNVSSVKLFDRDYISVLAYQKEFIQKGYENWESFYQAFREIMLFELKSIDLLVYVSVPFLENVKRTEKRDHRTLDTDELRKLYALRENMESEIKRIENQTPILHLNGMEEVSHNVEKIKRKVLNL